MAYSYREDFPAPAFNNPIMYQPFTKEEWAASNFASEDDLKWFRDARYGMFIHFGLSTYINEDLSWGVCHTRKAPDAGNGPIPDEEWQSWPGKFQLEKFDAKEWVKIAQDANFKYIVLITKHHDGFHMWDTAESEFKITNTPFGRDLAKEVVDACHDAGMPVGFYYSQRDWYHPDYMPVDPEKVTQDRVWWTLKPGYDSPVGECHKKYLEYEEKVVRELCTKYGKINVFWWDAIWFGNMFTAEMWDGENITRLIRELQPGIIMNNRCCVPGDFDTPEGRLGVFQNWRPWESCICLTEAWSYSATPPKELKNLVKMITNNVCGDGNLLLSWGPHWDGEFDSAEKARLMEFGEWMKPIEHTLFRTRGGPWKCNSWGGAVYRDNTIYLHITNLPGNVLVLPEIPGVTIQAVDFLDGTQVDYTPTDSGISLTFTDEQLDPLDTIVEITCDKALDGIEPIATGRQTMFSDNTTYGTRVEDGISVTASSHVSEFGELNQVLLEDNDDRVATQSEQHPWVVLDLGVEKTVTGVRVEYFANRQRKMTVKAFVSCDNSDWVDCGEVQQPYGEVPVNGMKSGASIPGRPARYVKIRAVSEEPTVLELKHVAVFAKETDC